MASLGSLNQHGGVILQFVVRVRSLLEQDLHNIEMTASTGQTERGVVIVGCLLVNVRPAAGKIKIFSVSNIFVSSFNLPDEELDRAQVTRPSGLHQRSPPALALVLQTSVVLEQEVCHVGVTVLTGVG